jgi:preprotein translocase subunit YajC
MARRAALCLFDERACTVTTYTLIAEDAAPAPAAGSDQQQGSPYTLFIMMALIFGVFYFLLIRPQQKKEKDRQKQRQEMLKDLKKNDHVMTIGGLHGIVATVTETEVTLKVDEKNDVRLRFSRDAMSKVVTEEDEKGEGQKLGENPEQNR